MPNLVGSKISSRYRVVRLLGRGGMGEVYLAKHLHTGEMVALKVLLAQTGATQQAVERFQREMRAPGRIKSDHVVRVTDADVAAELNGTPYLVMELLDGCDLQKPFNENRPCFADEVVWIFGQIARALDRAHGLGIVHRDLKPENLFLHRKEETGLIVKVLDFGIARYIEPQNWSVEAVKLTKTGVILGSPLYSSPEQIKGDLTQIGPASDIWSLGIIAFELLSGQHYWEAHSPASLIAAILFVPMLTPSQRSQRLSKAFDTWFATSCDRDPARRWPSVSAQAEALAAALRVNARHLQALEAPTSLRETVQALRAEAVHKDDDSNHDEDEVGQPKSIRNAVTRPAPEQATVLLRNRRSWIAGITGGALFIATTLFAGYRLFQPPKKLIPSQSDAPTTAGPSAVRPISGLDGQTLTPDLPSKSGATKASSAQTEKTAKPPPSNSSPSPRYKPTSGTQKHKAQPGSTISGFEPGGR